MTILISDTFTTASDTALTSHVPDVGTSWVEDVDTAGTQVFTCLAATGYLQCVSASSNNRIIATARPNPTSAEYDVSFAIMANGTGSQAAIGCVARFTDDNNFYAAITYPSGNTADKKLMKKVASTITELASGDAGLVAGDVLMFQVRDATKKLFFNSVEVLSSTDNALTSAGQAGFGFGSLLNSLDDGSSAHRLDNYSLDEIAPPSSGSLLPPSRSPVSTHMLAR